MPLIAPTEPVALRSAGKVSSLPETWGVDILLRVGTDWVGIQRKEMSDLVSSVGDGRLAKEVQQMRGGPLAVAVLVVEGRPKWTLDGALVDGGWGGGWTRDQHLSLLFSVQAEGIWVGGTDDVAGTVQYMWALDRWLRKANHTALVRRPAAGSVWGKPDNEDYQRHLVMGLPGVGPELADRIVKRFGGVPFRWRVGVEDLMTVDGIGRKKAEKIWGCMTA